MKLVMGYTKHGEKVHLVNGDDLAVALCGVRIAPNGLVRRTVHEGEDRGALVLYADHWKPGSIGSHDDGMCEHCVEREGRRR